MKEFFHKPVLKGKVFKPEWIQWGKIPKLSDMDMIVAYLDPSYKPKTTSDFKSWSIWGKKGLYLYLIDRYCAQATITEAIKWIYDYHEKLPQDVIVNYYMEEVFLQDMFYDDFDLEAQERKYALPISGDTRKKPDKYARIEATAPYYERGYVIYNEKKKDSHHMQTGLDMVLGFQKGSAIHDDAPDSDEGAIWILNNASRQESFTPMLGDRQHKSRY
jgi:predicted phage terminase large subunit-like protein